MYAWLIMLNQTCKGVLMLKEKMYVRCPADAESITDPRIFVCGQVIKVDEFKKVAKVRIYDPFKYQILFENLPKGTIEVPLVYLTHCSLFLNSEVIVNGEKCTILTEQLSKDGYYYYYVQNVKNKSVFKVSETDIIAAFNNGKVDPAIQLKKYEFQNPSWFFGHAVVSRSMNILENSIYGFKELAGSKIYLLPHQINTIMRCLQADPCRYMLADEVGMGKTIEAISVLKIYLQDKSNTKILIVVPDTLKEQWKTELLLKFNISLGINKDNNYVIIKSMSEININDSKTEWDFLIVDEIHRYLTDNNQYKVIHKISKCAKNVLLLSATPVQQRKEEYLDLLKVLQPQKYDSLPLEAFSELIEKQGRIIQKTALVLDDLADFEEEISNILDDEENPHESEDCKELFEEIYEELEEICETINDEKLTVLLEKISFGAEDLSVYEIKVIISYICSNYQLENNIIRNRRKILEINDDGEQLLPIRELTNISYNLDNSKNIYETICYQELADWITENANSLDVVNVIAPLLGAMFSSVWALNAELKRMTDKGIIISPEIISNANKWMQSEEYIIENLKTIIDNPHTYEDSYNTRLMVVLDLIYDELYDQKIVLFTNYIETFEKYKEALESLFSPDEISFFGGAMQSDEIELNVYRFQNDLECRIMLCDYTGGEGRNFQCADYIVHIDLPWDANMIEQRIGRLDRLERDKARPIVNSVVVYTKDTFEEALFDFWSKGLKIFNQSLSGMEIIMKDINHEIIMAVQENFKYGLFERIPAIIKLAEKMRETVRKEQNYDAAGFMFRPMYAELKRLIDYYARNENELFASTMTNWASLAGFRGTSNKENIITYAATSFSPKSAINAQLIPPRWDEYINSEQNKFLNRVQQAYEKSKSIQSQDRSIRGTFIRKTAIENDYLHFYAPGDEVFDCIVNNAILSCKGKACAFAIRSDINWKGLIFTWSVLPNEAILLDNNLSIHALSMYRNYLMSSQIIIPVSIENHDNLSEEIVYREYMKIISAGYRNNNTIHLGKRSKKAGFLKDIITSSSNINWFKEEYPEDVWKNIVISSRKSAQEKVLEQLKRRSNIRGAREEMERLLSARMANCVFYGTKDDTLENLKKEQELILEALRRPKIVLDSVAYVWMEEKNDAESTN